MNQIGRKQMHRAGNEQSARQLVLKMLSKDYVVVEVEEEKVV